MIFQNSGLRVGLAAGLAIFSAMMAKAQPPLEALPSILQLQLSQRPAWRAYKDAAAESHADAAQAAAHAALLNAMTTPQRLNALRIDMQTQQQTFARQATATNAFYAVLSPEQRDIFDEVTRVPPPRFSGGSHPARPSSDVLAAGGLRPAPAGAALPAPSR